MNDLVDQLKAISHVDPFEKSDYEGFRKRYLAGGSAPTETAWLKYENTRHLRTIGKLDHEIKQLRDVLDVATEEVVKLQAENAELKRRLTRRWNGKTHPFHCPDCHCFVKLEGVQVDAAGRILYIQAWCNRCRATVTPVGKYTLDDIKNTLPELEEWSV